MSEEDGMTLEEAYHDAKDGIAKVESLFGVSRDTACLLWMLMSINDQLVEQNEFMLGCACEPPSLPGDEWKDE